jgi:YVTN family beta-propeller protein
MTFSKYAIAAAMLLAAAYSSSQTVLATVPVANYPQGIAVNTFTNHVYVIEESANQVTDIDGLTDTAATIPLGTNSQGSLNGALAVNPLTNKIYAVDGVNNHLSVIDGATRTVTQVQVGNAPVAVAVNRNKNMVYVAN